MNATAYESLHIINQATQQIAEHIERLTNEGLLLPQFAEIRRLAAEQNCAEINVSAILRLVEREQAEAARVERERMEKEKALESGDRA
jgi:hypothetical protein